MRPRIRRFAKCGLLKDFTFPPLVQPVPEIIDKFSRKQAQNARFQWLNTSLLGLFSRKRGSLNSGTGFESVREKVEDKVFWAEVPPSDLLRVFFHSGPQFTANTSQGQTGAREGGKPDANFLDLWVDEEP